MTSEIYVEAEIRKDITVTTTPIEVQEVQFVLILGSTRVYMGG